VKEKIKNSPVALHEAFVAGLVTLILLGIIGFAVYVVYSNGAAMAQGFGAALAVGLLGGVVRYFKTTRKLHRAVFLGKMFHD
jgi:cation transporter-like permease